MFPKTIFLDLPPEIRLLILEAALKGFELVVESNRDRRGQARAGDTVVRQLDESHLPGEISSLFSCSKQVRAEASNVFFASAQFFTTVTCRPHRWFDMSKVWFQRDITVPSHNIRSLKLDIYLGRNIPCVRGWLEERMVHRKDSLFFSQLVSLQRLDIAVFVWREMWSNDQQLEQADSDSDLVAWLVQSIPYHIELRWVLPTSTPSYESSDSSESTDEDSKDVMTSVSLTRLGQLEAAHAHLRGTSTNIKKDKRRTPSALPAPQFMEVWSQERQSKNEKLKQAKESYKEQRRQAEESFEAHNRFVAALFAETGDSDTDRSIA